MERIFAWQANYGDGWGGGVVGGMCVCVCVCVWGGGLLVVVVVALNLQKIQWPE